MEITNKKLQDTFKEYLDGEEIEWYLARIFYDQYGGFARRTADEQKAIGISPKEGSVVIAYIDIRYDEEEEKLMAAQEDSIEVPTGREEYEKLKYIAEYSFNTKPKMDLKDPDNQNDMFG